LPRRSEAKTGEKGERRREMGDGEDAGDILLILQMTNNKIQTNSNI